MPRFYFNLYNDLIAMDEEGAELPDLETARERAIEGVRSLMAETVMQGRLQLQHRIEVADADGRVLMTIPFREVLSIEG